MLNPDLAGVGKTTHSPFRDMPPREPMPDNIILTERLCPPGWLDEVMANAGPIIIWGARDDA